MVGQERAPVAKLPESGFDKASQASELKLATSSKYIHCICRASKTMRISEILDWNNEPAEPNDYKPQLDQLPARFSGDLTKLAGAFTRRGLVKHFWNLHGSEGQPSGPAPPDAEPELIPSGTMEPTMASWQAEPVENEPGMGLHRLVPMDLGRP